MRVITLVCVGLGAEAWGSWAGYLAHPARAGAWVVILARVVLSVVAGLNVSSGKREDVRSRWIFLQLIVGIPLLSWLPPYMDRRDMWVLDGDAARYLGLVLLVAGAALRVWPMFVLGQRFSGLVAIQEHHELVTDGIYGRIRHPSYLGALLGFAGWVLVFRSSVGLALIPAAAWLTVTRMDAEEAMLVSEFGSVYSVYRQRKWRLVPWLY